MTTQRTARLGPLSGLLIAGALALGCASTGSGPGAASTAPPVMDQHRLEQLFADEVEAITGPVGALQTEIRGIPVFLFSDANHDRMRIFAAIARIEDIQEPVRSVLLTANFHTTLDARYAFSNGFVFAVFMHPISSLTPDHLRSGLAQVVSLVETFGSTYSSGVMNFAPPSRSEGRPEGDAEGPS